MATSNVNINITVDTAFSGVFETSLSDGLRPNIVQESPHLTRCIIAFFQNGTEISSMRKVYTSEEGYELNGLTATLSLDTGTTYTIVVYMDNNKDYVDITNLKEITISKSEYMSDGNPQIFGGKCDFTVSDDATTLLTVTRRYNAISFADTNPTSRVVNKRYFFNSYCPIAYNAYTGKIVDAIAGVHFDNIDKINVLATQTKQTLSFALDSYDASGNIVKAINNASVESQANYLTKVYYSSALRKSIDLTTLPGWASLSTGSHSITIVAKADGYRDSEPSEGVTVTKEAADDLAGIWLFNATVPAATYVGAFWTLNATMSADGYSVTTPCVMNGYDYYQLAVAYKASTNVGRLTFPTYGSGSSYKGWKGFRYFGDDYTGSQVSAAGWYYSDSTQFIPCSAPILKITSKLTEVENGDKLLAYLQANATKQS